MTLSQAVTTSTRPSARARRVLVVDDDSIQQAFISHVLDTAGFTVFTANDGQDALHLARDVEPDVIVLDAVMPEMDGFEVLEVLRADPVMATLPTVVVSGLDDVESRLKAFAVGADDFVVKPVDGGELVARVRAQLRIADAWSGRHSSMVTSLRSVRQRIIDTPPGRAPDDVARSLVERFPRDLPCSSLVAVEAGQVTSWLGRPEHASLVQRSGITTDELPDGVFTIDGDDSEHCPLCDRAGGGGTLLAAAAGSWDTGTALLLFGCTRRQSERAAELIAEVVEASKVVVSQKMQGWAADAGADEWLDHLIRTSAFDIWFQPVVDLGTGELVAHEALARFHDGSSPVHVLEQAAHLDRTVALELALIEAAITSAVSLPTGIPLHVNVSPLAAAAPELVDLIAGADRRVVLEITERELFAAQTAEHLRSMLPAGSLLAADDVGAGYSGLAQLLDVRPDILKIDRSVVVDIDHDAARQALVAGLVRFAEATGSSVIAEGIERAAQVATLEDLGVSRGQGYYFSKPRPLAQVEGQTVYRGASVGESGRCPLPAMPEPADDGGERKGS